MKRFAYLSIVLTLCCSTTATAITLDGQNIPSEAWSLRATQDSPTAFGNAIGGNQSSGGGSELNQFYAIVPDDNPTKLQIGITGNLESNNNKLYILFDGQPGGENVLAADNVDGPAGSTQIGALAGRISFPAGITMDHGLKFELTAGVFNVNYFNLINNTFINVATGAGVPGLPLVGAGGPGGVTVGWDNSNGLGVSNIDASTANTATTGWEIELDLPTAFNGNQDNIHMVAFIAGDTATFLSNQSLPALNSIANIGGGNILYSQVVTVAATPGQANIPGDVDGDGDIDMDDFHDLRVNWLATSASLGRPILRTDGDLNVNGIVDIQDFREWKANFTGGAGGIAEALAWLSGGAHVPEPSSILLVCLALALGAARRRRN